MYSRFPFSMENIPRPRSVGCLSLKLGCIITALVLIVHSVLGLSQCSSALINQQLGPEDQEWTTYTFVITIYVMIVQSISFTLSFGMLVGALRDKAILIKPWVVWNAIYLGASLLMFFMYTMTVVTQFDDGALFVYLGEFLLILIRFYMLTIVASFYKQLMEDQAESERLRKLINTDTWYTEL